MSALTVLQSMANFASIERTKKEAHIVAVPLPFKGHLVPLLEIVDRLSREGISISVILTSDMHSFATSYGELSHDCSTGLPIRLISLTDWDLAPGDHYDDGAGLDALQLRLDGLTAKIEDVLQKIQKEASSPQITCLLSDMGFYGAQELAEKFSINLVRYWHQSAASLCYYSCVAQGLQIPTDEHTIISCIPGAPPHTLSSVPTNLRPEIVGEIFFSSFLKPYKDVDNRVPIFLNTVEPMEPEALKALRAQGWNILCVGPLLHSMYSMRSTSLCSPLKDRLGSHECLSWLDLKAEGSVLYVCFGTLFHLQKKEFEEVALGIEESNLSFLWSLHSDHVPGDCRSFLEGFIQRTKLRGLVLPWVPQLDVLSHRSVGGFLSHCGWNSTLESIYCGVPMIGRPVGADQPLNLLCLCETWKMCLRLDGEIDKEKVKNTITDLFARNELKDSADRLRDVIGEWCEKGYNTVSFEVLVRLIKDSESPK